MGFLKILAVVGLMIWIDVAGAEDDLLIPHRDVLVYDRDLTLAEVIETTVENFPKSQLAKALKAEADAWQRRAKGFLAGPVMLGTTYNGDQVGDDSGHWLIATDLTFMIWKWGQRHAASLMAGQATRYAQLYRQALTLQVAGMVREALWDLQLKRVDYQTSKKVLALSDKLTAAVRRRVAVGDLPRSDLLLAETDLLERQSEAVTAEAEWMHARRRYLNLVRMDRAPAQFEESLGERKAITADHPLLAAASARIDEEKARAQWTRYESDTGNQQIYFSVGSTHEHSERGGQTDHGIAANLTVPIGGGSYQAPNVAEIRTAVAEAEAQRGELYRSLEQDLHEAEHNLLVAQNQSQRAQERQRLAQTNLELSRKAFAAGEMDLIDLLKIQLMAQQAERDRAQWQVREKLGIARYNQTIGILP